MLKFTYGPCTGGFALVAVVLLLQGCGGTVTENPSNPTTPTDTTTPPVGTVQRTSLTATFTIAPEDAAIATQAGFTLVGATARLQHMSSADAERVAVVGPNGTAKFDSLFDGQYVVSIDHALTAAELARLSPEQRDASIFAGGAEVIVSPPSAAAVTVSLVAASRGSLVISEHFVYRATPPFSYPWGSYLEVYNNADTTIYLDKIVYFRTTNLQHQDFGRNPCDASIGLRTDPQFIWVYLIHAFPGAGSDYPIAPGTAKVVAMDALNHRVASSNPLQHDLSHAAFEEIGSESDIDNPFVPNLVRVRAGTGALGRGYPMTSMESVGLALPSSIAQLDSTDYDVLRLYRLPISAILDVASFSRTPSDKKKLEDITGPMPECTPWINTMVERAVAPLADTDDPRANARKTLERTADGREILQRTRTSARDFEPARPLRRSLEK